MTFVSGEIIGPKSPGRHYVCLWAWVINTRYIRASFQKQFVTRISCSHGDFACCSKFLHCGCIIGVKTPLGTFLGRFFSSHNNILVCLFDMKMLLKYYGTHCISVLRDAAFSQKIFLSSRATKNSFSLFNIYSRLEKALKFAEEDYEKQNRV